MKEKVVFRKEVTWSHIIAAVTILSSMFWYTASQNTRITLLEESDIRQEKSFERLERHTKGIHDDLKVIIKELQYQKGINSKG